MVATTGYSDPASRFAPPLETIDVSNYRTRREFLSSLGLGAAALPFVTGLTSLARGAETPRKQRIVIMFSPNGVVPSAFWPDEEGAEFKLKESLSPLEKLRERTLILAALRTRLTSVLVRSTADPYSARKASIPARIE